MPILTNSVRYIAIAGAVYVYVGDAGRKGRGRFVGTFAPTG